MIKKGILYSAAFLLGFTAAQAAILMEETFICSDTLEVSVGEGSWSARGGTAANEVTLIGSTLGFSAGESEDLSAKWPAPAVRNPSPIVTVVAIAGGIALLCGFRRIRSARLG